MSHTFTKIVILLVVLSSTLTVAAQHSQQQRLQQHIYYMAADSLRGRAAGSADAQKVAQYIMNEYQQMGLEPLFGNYLHYFSQSQSNAIATIRGQQHPTYCDIAAVIEGCDPILKNEYILVGAHYDHLGTRNGEVYNGADDNASGSAAVIEIARTLMQHRAELKRSVIIAAFDAEELGLFGSDFLAYELKPILNNIKLMMSIDMVGWLQQGKTLQLEGTKTLNGCDKILNEVAQFCNMPISTKAFEQSIFTATDTEPFATLGVPTLAITTGSKSPYHKPQDDADLIDYQGLDRICDYLTQVILRMGSTSEPLTPSGKRAFKHRDRLPLFEIGPLVGGSQNQLAFPDAAFTGKLSWGYQTGVTTRLNLNWFVIEADVLFCQLRSRFPDRADIFNSSLTYRQQSLEIPVTLLVQTPDLGGCFHFYAGLGAHYHLLLRTSDADSFGEAHTQQYGWHFSAGFRLSQWALTLSEQYQINDLFIVDGTAPRCKNRTFTITLSYLF